MAGVQIDGLRAFARALKEVDAKYPAQLRDADKKVAKEITARAKARGRSLGSVAGKTAREGLRAGSGASVLLGGSRAPFSLGAEFGALQYRQFKSWRGNQWGGWSGGPGYFLHPTIRDEASELIDEYADTLMRLYSEAFPE